MQQSDERPPASNRPSLLSAEQQAEVDRKRQSAKPDSSKTAAGKPGGGRASVAKPPGSPGSGSGRKFALTGAGVAVVALCGAAALWVADGGPPAHAPMQAVAQASVPVPVTAPKGELKKAPAQVLPAAASEVDVSTAAILEDAPAAATAPAAPKEKSLKEILHTPSAAANPVPDELSKLLNKPVPPTPLPAAAKKAPKRMVEAPRLDAKLVAHSTGNRAKSDKQAKGKDKAREKPHQLAAAVPKKKEVHPKAAAPMDSDEALLAALVAHSKSHPEKIRPGSTAAKLKQCGKQSSANAAKCRERICDGSGKDDLECKGVRLAKATGSA